MNTLTHRYSQFLISSPSTSGLHLGSETCEYRSALALRTGITPCDAPQIMFKRFSLLSVSFTSSLTFSLQLGGGRAAEQTPCKTMLGFISHTLHCDIITFWFPFCFFEAEQKGTHLNLLGRLNEAV